MLVNIKQSIVDRKGEPVIVSVMNEKINEDGSVGREQKLVPFNIGEVFCVSCFRVSKIDQDDSKLAMAKSIFERIAKEHDGDKNDVELSVEELEFIKEGAKNSYSSQMYALAQIVEIINSYTK